ncbi:putative double-stranded RNA-binding domain-containing protein [Septoria linicola]|nr:putative double-stranded RNA-binding domain-containing protein [Septoria linicola]
MENMAPSHNLSSFGGGPMELMSMDDFEKANPYTPPPPRRTAPPLRTTSKHGQFSSQFHLACDARGIVRDFVFHMVAQHCYDVELRLNGKFLDRIGQYASHKDAREEICKKHLATVEAMPNQKKRKVSDAAYHPVPAGIDDELWVNLVYEYTQKNQLPPPDFELSGSAGGHLPPWTCTLRIKGSPFTPFGGTEKEYAIKMNAKKAAAMEAVQWLRAQTKMAPAPDKRRKSVGAPTAEAMIPASPASLPDEPGHTGLAQTLRSFDVNANNGRPSEQVHQLAMELGFTQPSYRHIAVPMSDAFYNTFAEFIEKDVRREPRLGGQVGLVSNIYGKNTAKQECATLVLGVLAEIRRSRIMH